MAPPETQKSRDAGGYNRSPVTIQKREGEAVELFDSISQITHQGRKRVQQRSPAETDVSIKLQKTLARIAELELQEEEELQKELMKAEARRDELEQRAHQKNMPGNTASIVATNAKRHPLQHNTNNNASNNGTVLLHDPAELLLGDPNNAMKQLQIQKPTTEAIDASSSQSQLTNTQLLSYSQPNQTSTATRQEQKSHGQGSNANSQVPTHRRPLQKILPRQNVTSTGLEVQHPQKMPREPSKGDPRSTLKKVHSLNRIGDRARTRTRTPRQLAADVEPKKHAQNLPVHLHANKSKQREGTRDATLAGGDGVGGMASSQVTPFWGIVSPPRSSPPFHFEITLSERDADFLVTSGRESLEGSLDSARCGSCGHFGHRLIDCIFMDNDGFVSGCPLCNDKRHKWDDCKRKHELSEREVYHVVVQRRGNKPAIASSQPWIQLVARAQLKMFRVSGSTTGPFPWTAKLAQSIRNGTFRTKKSAMPVLYHVWYNYRDDEGPGPRNKFLVSDPVTSSLQAVGVNAKRLMKSEVCCSPQP